MGRGKPPGGDQLHRVHHPERVQLRYGDYTAKYNSILSDPNNAEKHAEEAAEATKRMNEHLRDLAVEAGTHAAAGPFQEAAAPH